MAQTSQNETKKSIKRLARLDGTMFSSFRPIFCFSRIFGSIPFSIVCNSNGEVQSCEVRVVDYMWFAISICVYITMVIFSYKVFSLNAANFHENATFVLFLVNAIFQWLSLIFGALFFVVNMWNRQIFIDFLKMFEQFDKEAS